jgi:hypothetical protein
MKLTERQEHLVKEAFTYVIDSIDEEGSLPVSMELDGYGFHECSTNTLKALKRKGLVAYFEKHLLEFSVTWNSEKVYEWMVENDYSTTTT